MKKQTVTVHVYDKQCDDNNKQLVGLKTFEIHPSPNSHSMGYMIGYVQCISDNGLFAEMGDDYWELHGSYPPDEF